MVSKHRALLLAAAAFFFVPTVSATANATLQSSESPSTTVLYKTVTLEIDADQEYRAAATGETDSSDPNPWLHRRLDVYFDHPDLLRPLRVPGYFAGDGQGSSDGCIWRVHFTPQLQGDWIWFAAFESGSLINAAPTEARGTAITIQSDAGDFFVEPRDPNAPGFRSKGLVTAERGKSYFRYSEEEAGRFVVAGVGSPENFLGYVGFSDTTDGRSANGAQCCCKQNCFNDCRRTTCQSTDDPAPNFLHRYLNHLGDWNPGDPDWSANGLAHQGRAIIGALNYLGEVGVNSLYFMLMNLGGDGKDTHPFLTDGGGMDCPMTGSGFSPAHTLNYHVQRMDQWRTVFEHAGSKGIMLQFILAEQEACNIRWFGPHDSNGGSRNHLSLYRRLFMKQMIAEFGHLHGVRWNLCEENRSSSFCQSVSSGCGAPTTPLTPQFTATELDEMARWIRSWDAHAHPIGVHTIPNSTTIYEDLLALPEQPAWLSSTSLQIHGEVGSGAEYEALTQSALQIFAQAGQTIPIINDEQGSSNTGLSSHLNPDAVPTSTADDRRRRVLYDVMLSGGQVSYYFGYYSLQDGGGDLRCENFRTRRPALEQLGIAHKLLETIKIWEMSDQDPLLVGATANQKYARPEVAISDDNERVIVYYPALREDATSAVLTGRLDLRAAPLLTYRLFWVDPTTGEQVGQGVTIQGGAITPVPIPDINGDGVPGNAVTPDTDLLLLLLSRGPTPTTTE